MNRFIERREGKEGKVLKRGEEKKREKRRERENF